MSDQMLENYNQNRYKDGKSGDQEIDWLYTVTSAEAPEVDVDMAWEKVSGKIAQKSTEKITNTFPFLRIAASVTLLAICVFVFRGYFNGSPDLLVRNATNGKSEVVFPDGSRAVLNINSQVKFLEEFGEIREVQFSGEAYFDIKKSTKQFVIKMGDIDVRVLGTAFNLSTNQNSIKIFVDHGLVSLGSKDKKVKVAEGELGIFDYQTSELIVDTTPPANMMSWRNGTFTFHETTLDEATFELAEYYGVTFEVPDKLKNCKITATFDNAPLKEVLNVLEAILSVRIEQDNSKVKIEGKGC
ncbi:MAG: DUF4974 domain-containing protein [Cytophagales bacterium]|nr:DUF4974 domain-containing protein [Cytophagales bacterium]